MPHKLLIAARQKTKIRSAFANNIFTDIKLSKTQFCKITESGKKALIDLAVPLAVNIFPKLATKAERKKIMKEISCKNRKRVHFIHFR